MMDVKYSPVWPDWKKLLQRPEILDLVPRSWGHQHNHKRAVFTWHKNIIKFTLFSGMFKARVQVGLSLDPRSSLYHISCLVTRLSYSITPILLTMLVIIKIRIHQKLHVDQVFKCPTPMSKYLLIFKELVIN